MAEGDVREVEGLEPDILLAAFEDLPDDPERAQALAEWVAAESIRALPIDQLLDELLRICSEAFELSHCALLLLDDARLRDSLGGKGLQYVRENYAWPRIVDKYERLFSHLTSTEAPA